jgi:hypothetical protein
VRVLGSYEIMQGRKCVGVRLAPSSLMALVDYLRAAGCGDADVIRLGTNAVSWRGAVYRASLVPDEGAGSATAKATT